MRMECPVSSSRKPKPSVRKARKPSGTRPSAKPKKRAKNLSLSPEAIAHGEAYSRQHGTKLSKLVGDFLRALPLGERPARELSPAVRRLYGVAAGARAGVEGASSGIDAYREHLSRKYGGR